MDREEQIAAYLDGALGEDEARAFEAELERDAGLAEALARHARNDGLLREAFALDDAPADRATLERFGLAPALPVAANDNSRFWYKAIAGGALAAALVLAATFAMPGNWWAEQSGATLATALEGAPSGKALRLADGGTLTPVLTVRARDGRYCREFTLAREGGEPSGGLACRSGDGGWTVEGWGNAAALPDGSEVALAAGADTRSLDQAYAAVGAGDPIDAAREARAIARGWPVSD